MADEAGRIDLVMDLCIAHERWGSSPNPVLHDLLYYPLPPDIDNSLNEDTTEKLRE